jgi:hypothetical protein
MPFLIYKRLKTNSNAKNEIQFQAATVLNAFRNTHYKFIYYCFNYKVLVALTNVQDIEELFNYYNVNTNIFALVFWLDNKKLQDVGQIQKRAVTNNKFYHYAYITPQLLNYDAKLWPYITSIINYYDNLNVNNALSYFTSSFRAEKFTQVEDFGDNYKDNIQATINPIAYFDNSIAIQDFEAVDFVVMIKNTDGTNVNLQNVSQDVDTIEVNDNNRRLVTYKAEYTYDFTPIISLINTFSQMTILPYIPDQSVLGGTLNLQQGWSISAAITRKDVSTQSKIPTIITTNNMVYLDPTKVENQNINDGLTLPISYINTVVHEEQYYYFTDIDVSLLKNNIIIELTFIFPVSGAPGDYPVYLFALFKK